MEGKYIEQHPDKNGYFGEYGGAFLPPELVDHFKKISDLYEEISGSESFLAELRDIREHFST